MKGPHGDRAGDQTPRAPTHTIHRHSKPCAGTGNSTTGTATPPNHTPQRSMSVPGTGGSRNGWRFANMHAHCFAHTMRAAGGRWGATQQDQRFRPTLDRRAASERTTHGQPTGPQTTPSHTCPTVSMRPGRAGAGNTTHPHRGCRTDTVGTGGWATHTGRRAGRATHGVCTPHGEHGTGTGRPAAPSGGVAHTVQGPDGHLLGIRLRIVTERTCAGSQIEPL